MEPAATIVSKFGGPSKLASIVGVHRTRVSNWTRAKEAGGSGGRIPQAHHRAILAASRDLSLGITAEDLLPAEREGVEAAPISTPEPHPEPEVAA